MQGHLFAQVDSTYIHGVDYKAYFDSIYSPLDFSGISSGIFMGKVLRFAVPDGFDGSSGADTVRNQWQWEQLMLQFHLANIDSIPAVPNLDTIRARGTKYIAQG